MSVFKDEKPLAIPLTFIFTQFFVCKDFALLEMRPLT